jgi:hypothetical protein
MKKQFLFTAVIISGILFSCSKEKIETPESTDAVSSSNSQKGGGSISVNLNKGLLGRYEFNNTLKDTTGQLPDGISTVGRVLYTTDRKGVANRAIYFNEGYGVDIFGVPLGKNMSVAVWVQNHFFPTSYMVAFVTGSKSFCLSQLENTYQAAYWNGINGQYTTSGAIDDKWHHLVATRDDISLKFYIDGVFIGSSPTPAGAGPYSPTSDYSLGYGYNAGYKYWQGSMDDLRIYSRVLSASDITALYNL